MSTYQIKIGDRRPTLNAVLRQGSDYGASVPINLTDCTVRIRLFLDDGSETPVIDQPCTILSAVGGSVSYSWRAEDVDESIRYYGEFQITYPDGTIMTVPTVGTFAVVVQPHVP